MTESDERTESDQRLDAVADKIEDAKAAAAPLAEDDVIDPDRVAGEPPSDPDGSRA